MKILLLSLLLASLTHAQEEACTPVPEEVIAVLTTLSVPNCRKASNIDSSVAVSRVQQMRVRNNLRATSARNPICDGCRADFQTRVSGNIDISAEKKRAFFDTTYKELEKALSSIVVDAVSLRTTYSTNTNFPKSVAACNSRSIEQELTRCNSPFLNAFKQKNLYSRLGNEAAALISTSQAGIAGILERSNETQSCNISDEIIQSLKPKLFEEMITPAIVQSIAGISSRNADEFTSGLRNALGENFDIISKHPILKELMKEPAVFLQTFQSLRNQSPETLKAALRNALYNPTMGNLIDTSNASKCESTIRGFTTAMCSPSLKSGNIALGPFANFDKFLDNGDVSDSDLTINENQLKDNLVMFEFCNPAQNETLSLNSVLSQMNNWMNADDKESALSTYSINKYNRDFGETKALLCRQLASNECSNNSNANCALFRLYTDTLNPSTPAGRLAAAPDRGMNSVIRALIGDSAGVSPQARETLVQAGIIPQENGQLVERPTPPERQPDYLANVANGTITPGNSGSQTASTPTTRRTPPNRPQGQAQLQQPGPTSAVQPETQLAEADITDEERRFQEGLDERLRRVEGQPDPATTQQQSQVRRTASRVDNSNRNPNRQPASASVIPTQISASSDVVNPDQSAPTPQTADASLAPDSSRQTRAQRQANEARAQMAGARSNPSATTEGGPNPTTADGSTSAVSVALTISGDIPANLEQVLRSTDSRGSDLRSLIEARRPFRFQLNNSLFDVRITNGVYTVAYRSGDDSQRALASTLQTLFNNSIRNTDRTPARSTTLEALQKTVRN